MQDLQKRAFLTLFTTFQDLHLKWGWFFIVFVFLGTGFTRLWCRAQLFSAGSKENSVAVLDVKRKL